MKTISMRLLAGALSLLSLSAGAQTTNPTAASPVSRETPSQTRLIGGFTAFAGSQDNARSLVTGLRQGSEITLTTPTSGGQSGTGSVGTGIAPSAADATFTPPTRPMGYGNIRIALSLARTQLAQAGITQPTPAQIEAALMGGPLTNGSGATAGTGTTTLAPELRGILQMRADGMGWGQIANSMGVKLGQVMSGRTPPPGVPPADAPAATQTGAGTGITTAVGAASTATTARSRGNSAAAQDARGSGAGIVTAAGATAAAPGAGARAQGGGNGAGVVTGAGVSAGGSVSSSGRALAKGHVNP